MDNFFITRYFDWAKHSSASVALVNQVLKLLGRSARLESQYSTGKMTCVEQRMNMYHFVSQVVAYEVEGEFVELGCNTGQSAALYQKVMKDLGKSREIHLYDSFLGDFPTGSQGLSDDEKIQANQEIVLQNFARHQLKAPIVHAGWFESTVPRKLPNKIAFAHIDAGPGASHEALRASVLHCLTHVYPRLSPGGICLLMDYCRPEQYESWNENPAVREAVDEFMTDKPEEVIGLYAGEYSQGFFRKALV